MGALSRHTSPELRASSVVWRELHGFQMIHGCYNGDNGAFQMEHCVPTLKLGARGGRVTVFLLVFRLRSLDARVCAVTGCGLNYTGNRHNSTTVRESMGTATQLMRANMGQLWLNWYRQRYQPGLQGIERILRFLHRFETIWGCGNFTLGQHPREHYNKCPYPIKASNLDDYKPILIGCRH